MGEGFFVGGLALFIVYCPWKLYSIMSGYLVMLRKNTKMLLCFTGGTCLVQVQILLVVNFQRGFFTEIRIF